MPVVKYVAVHSTPLSNIEYILNGEKNDDMKFASGINCSASPQSAYDEFRRTFEHCAKEHFFKSDMDLKNYGTEEKPKRKEKVRIHHYIQSFDPKENVTPEEAHKIGIEWARKTFGENMQVIVSTHLDKGHIHNHFAVCPYNLDGKQWYANYTTLNRARKISDKIALEHGLHIIENPKHKNTLKYSEWLARQNGTSWKDRLSAEIDKLILCDDVRDINDLADKLREKKYTVKCGKYLSVKAPKQKNAIRSFRLGDGYSVEDLKYRIEHKEKEISNAALEKYLGVQREYALVMRQMQIVVFTKKPTRVTYSDLRKSAELLNYLSSNNITSASELENRLNAAAEDYQNSVHKSKKLNEQIKAVEKIIEDGRVYLDLVDKDFLTPEEKKIYKQVSYVQRSIDNSEDLRQREEKLVLLKSELDKLAAETEKKKSERDRISELYRIFKCDTSDFYDEEIKRTEQEQKAASYNRNYAERNGENER